MHFSENYNITVFCVFNIAVDLICQNLGITVEQLYSNSDTNLNIKNNNLDENNPIYIQTITDYKVGRRIANLREKANLSQFELADSLGLSTKHLEEIETGDVETSLSLKKDIANFFQIKVDYLTGNFNNIVALNTINTDILFKYVPKNKVLCICNNNNNCSYSIIEIEDWEKIKEIINILKK